MCLPVCQTFLDISKVKDEKQYGVTRGLFQGRWWHFYERALSFADGGFWTESENDLREAIKQKKDDERRVQTFGMHFIDYFPHRELGIALYHKGNIEDAIKELTTSLINVKSTKAELYLDKARKALIERGDLDRQPPEIIISYPVHPFFTNKLSVVIRGIARDDTFVRHIKVGGKEVRVDVSNREIPFRAEVPVVPGKNVISVQAVDLSDKKTPTSVVVYVDRTGPTLSIDEPFENDLIPETGVSLKGYAYDTSGLVELVINGQKYQYDDNPSEVPIQQNVLIPPGEKELDVDVKDRAGNVTSVRITLSDEDLLADNGGIALAEILMSRQKQTSILPSIELICPKEEHEKTYLDEVHIKGNVKDKKGVEKVFASGEPVILKRAGRTIGFSHVYKLDTGENIIIVRCVNSYNIASRKEIKIRRYLHNVQTQDFRLELDVKDFRKNFPSGETNQKFSINFKGMFTKAILKRSRFRLTEGTDFTLSGIVTEQENSVEVAATVFKKKETIVVIDGYTENTGRDEVIKLSQDLAQKLTDGLPLKKGRVLEVNNNKITAKIGDLGDNVWVRRGMELIVYRMDVEDCNIVTKDFRILGYADITSVENEISFADLNPDVDLKAIRKGDWVITR
ncbi:MAG: hypothetical protein GY795_51720 [Desulfobacterales bacterium]|nr:hypothetical protein [Desulfobacterales bacterium]